MGFKFTEEMRAVKKNDRGHGRSTTSADARTSHLKDSFMRYNRR